MPDLHPSFVDTIGRTDAPEDILTHPSMMSLPERSLLYNLGKSHFRGDGLIIDAGLFLGASTRAFASGIKANPAVYEKIRRSGIKPINAYEIAIWSSEGFDKYLADPKTKALFNGRTYQDGESYLPTLESLISEHSDLVDLRIGDIVALARADRPIEIAFYDCLKNYERDWAVFKAFAPHFIPGHTVVIQQDYFYEGALECKIRQELLSPYFSFLGAAATSGVFRLEREIPQSFFEEDPVLGLSADDQIRLLLQAAGRIPAGSFQVYAALGAVSFMIDHRRLDQAHEHLSGIEECLGKTPSSPRAHEVKAKMRKWLDGRRGAPASA